MKCPLCHNTSFDVLYKDLDRIYKTSHYGIYKPLSIQKCFNCEQVFIFPQLEYTELKNYFNNEYRAFSVKKRNKKILQKLQSFLKNKTLEQFFGYGDKKWWRFLLYQFSIPLAHYPNKKTNGKILDIGCGSGNYLTEVKKFGWKVYGVDSSNVAIEVAKNRGLNKVFLSGAQKLPFEDNFFDVVSMFHVFEHIRNPLDVLLEIKRVLKPDGVLIIGVPNFSSFGSKLYGKYWSGLSFPLHYFLYTKITLKNILVSQKFGVLKMYYPNFFSDILEASIENFLSPRFDYDIPRIIKYLLNILYKITSLADYFIGNLFSHIFKIGSQITVVSKNKK